MNKRKFQFGGKKPAPEKGVLKGDGNVYDRQVPVKLNTGEVVYVQSLDNSYLNADSIYSPGDSVQVVRNPIENKATRFKTNKQTVKKKQFGGNAVVEDGELYKDEFGNIQEVEAPLHEDEVLIDQDGNAVNVPAGEGGKLVDAQSVASDSYEKVKDGVRPNSQKEKVVRFSAKESSSLLSRFPWININKAMSPSELIREATSQTEIYKRKFDKGYANDQYSQNSKRLNLQQIPTEEELYDLVVNAQEQKKHVSGVDFETEEAQYGGVPESLNGLHDYPNQPVVVPSGDISMQGIDYPVEAYDANTGEYLETMQPEKRYKFGTSRVLEVPVKAQMGGDLKETTVRGRKPIYVDSADDQRYQSYQDSLRLYNGYRDRMVELKTKYPNLKETEVIDIPKTGAYATAEMYGDPTGGQPHMKKTIKANPNFIRPIRQHNFDKNPDSYLQSGYRAAMEYAEPQQEVIVGKAPVAAAPAASVSSGGIKRQQGESLESYLKRVRASRNNAASAPAPTPSVVRDSVPENLGAPGRLGIPEPARNLEELPAANKGETTEAYNARLRALRKANPGKYKTGNNQMQYGGRLRLSGNSADVGEFENEIHGDLIKYVDAQGYPRYMRLKDYEALKQQPFNQGVGVEKENMYARMIELAENDSPEAAAELEQLALQYEDNTPTLRIGDADYISGRDYVDNDVDFVERNVTVPSYQRRAAPVAASAPAPSEPDMYESRIPEPYRVKRGDSLSKIANAYGLTLDDLIKTNPNIADVNRIEVGDTINIPDVTIKAKRTPPPSAEPIDRMAEMAGIEELPEELNVQADDVIPTINPVAETVTAAGNIVADTAKDVVENTKIGRLNRNIPTNAYRAMMMANRGLNLPYRMEVPNRTLNYNEVDATPYLDEVDSNVRQQLQYVNQNTSQGQAVANNIFNNSLRQKRQILNQVNSQNLYSRRQTDNANSQLRNQSDMMQEKANADYTAQVYQAVDNFDQRKVQQAQYLDQLEGRRIAQDNDIAMINAKYNNFRIDPVTGEIVRINTPITSPAKKAKLGFKMLNF